MLERGEEGGTRLALGLVRPAEGVEQAGGERLDEVEALREQIVREGLALGHRHLG